VTDSVKVPFLDLRLREDAGAVREAIARVIARGWYVLGPEVDGFESEFAAASGARFAIGTGNGTDAITLMLRAAGIAAGDVITKFDGQAVDSSDTLGQLILSNAPGETATVTVIHSGGESQTYDVTLGVRPLPTPTASP